MVLKSVSTTVLVCLLVIILTAHGVKAQQSRSHCTNGLNRRIGLKESYVWVCDCVVDGIVVPVARVEIDATPRKEETQAGFLKFVRCFDRNVLHRKLDNVCQHNLSRWSRLTQHAVEECKKNSEPTAKEIKEIPGKFVVNKQSCTSRFSSFDTENDTVGILICNCEQKQINLRKAAFVDINLGRAGFSTEGSLADSSKELKFLRNCAQTRINGLKSVCARHPIDFTVFALHKLEVCCKRARSVFNHDSKFECKAIVPDDVGAFRPELPV